MMKTQSVEKHSVEKHSVKKHSVEKHSVEKQNDCSNELKPLDHKELNNIENSFDPKVYVPFVNPFYYIKIDINGKAVAYTTINGYEVIDNSIIPHFNGYHYVLLKEFLMNQDSNQIYYPISEENSQVTNETTISEIPSPDPESMISKLENLSIKYSFKMSSEKIRINAILLIKLALFSKSLIQNNSINPDYVTIFDKIVNVISSLNENLEHENNLSIVDVEDFLYSILDRIINSATVYRGCSGPRSIEDLKSITEHLGLPIPKHPKINGKYIGLKATNIDNQFIFPFRDYGIQLISLIISNLHNETVFDSLNVLILLWNKTNGLVDFVDEVRRTYG